MHSSKWLFSLVSVTIFSTVTLGESHRVEESAQKAETAGDSQPSRKAVIDERGSITGYVDSETGEALAVKADDDRPVTSYQYGTVTSYETRYEKDEAGRTVLRQVPRKVRGPTDHRIE